MRFTTDYRSHCRGTEPQPTINHKKAHSCLFDYPRVDIIPLVSFSPRKACGPNHTASFSLFVCMDIGLGFPQWFYFSLRQKKTLNWKFLGDIFSRKWEILCGSEVHTTSPEGGLWTTSSKCVQTTHYPKYLHIKKNAWYFIHYLYSAFCE